MTAPTSFTISKNDKKQKALHAIVGSCFVLLIIAEILLQSWRSVQIRSLEYEIEGLKQRLVGIENGQLINKRIKRQVEPNNLNEDGMPLREGSYTGKDSDSEGLRIYDAWYQHKNSNEIPRSRNAHQRRRKKPDQDSDYENPIKPYHRTSAAWVEKRKKSNHDLNAHFDENVYRDPYPARKKTSSGQAIDMPQSNYYKITPTEEPIVVEDDTTPNTINQLPLRRFVYNHQNETESQKSNRHLVRSGGGRKRHPYQQQPLRSIPQNDDDSLLNQFEGLKAIHYVGGHKGQDARVYEGEGNQENHDGIFRKWAPARWATRMRATLDFPLDNDGRLSVKKSGLYYIYAQVNYLDEHDVNAFQIFINDEPHFLCTVMTHTRHPTTKANTCFTSGVAFLEAEDQILVRDLEPMRNSVIRPSHTFFGLIQLSSN